MEYQLQVHLTLFDGSVVDQAVPCPPDPAKVQAIVNQLLAMYMSVGYVKAIDGGLKALRVNTAKIEIPTIMLAQPGDVPKATGKVSLA